MYTKNIMIHKMAARKDDSFQLSDEFMELIFERVYQKILQPKHCITFDIVTSQTK